MSSPSIPARTPLKRFAVLGEAVELDAGLEALVVLEVLQPGQGPVDARDETSRAIVARDRVGGVEHHRERPAQGGAVLDHHVAVGRRARP